MERSHIKYDRDCSDGLKGQAESRHYFSRGAIFMLCLICSFSIATSVVLANPTGGQVVAGNATISTPTPNNVLIKQSSDRAIINWQSFNIGAQEKTQFAQPSANSTALNRINASQ